MPSTDIPLSGLVDIRWPIPGNSFSWGADNVEPLAAKKRAVTHATAGLNVAEDGFTMAASHMAAPNNWPGVGVNFVITHDEYPGRAYPAGVRDDGSTYPAGSTPPGAQVQYVGDVSTIRAGVWGMNPGSIHVEICGTFTPGHSVPTQNQLRLLRGLYEFLCAPNNILPSLNYLNQVTYHNAIALPDHGTECPGWQHPQFAEWFKYLQGGPEPSWWTTAPPVVPIPNPPLPTPVPVIPEPTPGQGAGTPEYEATYHTQPETRTVNRPGAHGVDVTTGSVVVPTIAEGTVIDVAGYFTSNGVTYARTVYSATHNKWNGLDVTYFDAPTGQPSGEIPVTVVPSDPTAVATDVTDTQLQEATVPDQNKPSVLDLIKELIAQLIALVIKRKK